MTHQDALVIAALAWERVKPADDPPLSQCAPDHKFRLAYKVEGVAKGGKLEDEFDQEVYRILYPAKDVSPVTPIEEPAGEAQAEAPTVKETASETQDPAPIEQPIAPPNGEEQGGESKTEGAPATKEPKPARTPRTRAQK